MPVSKRNPRVYSGSIKIPPVVVVLLMAVFMWLMAWALPAAELVVPARQFLAASCAIAGIVTSALGVISFRRAGTTVNPLKPDSSSSLVRSGVYTFTRNPMYLGFLAMLLGWAIYMSNVLAFLFVPVFVLYMNRFQIDPEEKALTSRFGPEYVAYKSRVRRWL